MVEISAHRHLSSTHKHHELLGKEQGQNIVMPGQPDGRMQTSRKTRRNGRWLLQNVWMSDKSWEPGMLLKTWKLWKHKKWSLGHAEQLMFSCLGSKVTVYSRKLQCFFWDIIISSITLSCEFRSLSYHRAGSQLIIENKLKLRLYC